MINYIQKEPYPTKKNRSYMYGAADDNDDDDEDDGDGDNDNDNYDDDDAVDGGGCVDDGFIYVRLDCFFNPLKLNLFFDLLLDPEVDYRVPHANELQSTYHDWRTS